MNTTQQNELVGREFRLPGWTAEFKVIRDIPEDLVFQNIPHDYLGGKLGVISYPHRDPLDNPDYIRPPWVFTLDSWLREFGEDVFLAWLGISGSGRGATP